MKKDPHSARPARRDVLKGVVSIAAAGVIGAPMVARAQQKFVCRMGHSEAIGSPLTKAFASWTKVLNEKSGGRIDAQHFPASQLGSYTQNIEQNRLGTIQVTTGGPDTEEVIAPEIAATGGAPGFIYVDEAHVDRVLQGDIGKRNFADRAREDRRGVRRLRRGRLPPHPVEAPGDEPRRGQGSEDPHPGDQALDRFLEEARRQPDAAALCRAIQRALDRPDRWARSRRVLDQGLQMGRAGQEPDLSPSTGSCPRRRA